MTAEGKPAAVPPGTTITLTADRHRIGSGLEPIEDPVAVEAPLTIDIRDVAAYTVMASPADKRALALGFVLAEGLIESLDDIALLQECLDDPNVIRLALTRPPETAGGRRNMAVMSSCGLCGSQSVDDLVAALPRAGDQFRTEPARLLQVSQAMKGGQAIYDRTGGTHSAVIFDGSGRIVAQAEDIGRHNALDKAIGQCLLTTGGRPVGLAAGLSGRVSLEMVVKAARAGLELISAVSAPTSLAVEAAGQCNISLACFVRQGRVNVYTHPQRLKASD